LLQELKEPPQEFANSYNIENLQWLKRAGCRGSGGIGNHLVAAAPRGHTERLVGALDKPIQRGVCPIQGGHSNAGVSIGVVSPAARDGSAAMHAVRRSVV
jgi:hypothetical protein